MIKHAFYNFEFGTLKIGYTESAIISIRTVGKIDDKDEHSQLSDMAYEQICEYIKGRRKTFDFPYELHGTEFQKRVWNELCRIPYGETRTYKQVAEAAGNSKASRAAGAANGKNPIMIVIPCHRVIGTDGKLTGYAGGIELKKTLLNLEQGANKIY
ncbi:methylated-DNA--[protein]-cysteine S-methyltransferase [Sedimentibacter hydroxybenzoicus DSM 7310]|uniref:Methylated-DNA--protein-cysteine methyltransferase n=1 Tax=Sedimentibacter hydroxybenzoicus DSM 7310 TaxID=1123245 RepID=A0A974GWQ5_SEDHY|nr:methylated-DNA--[protein]-cysteine S-methyltransferase [Sedimentibacter hydroxybenzoicus]NYB74752.1 methylated-DNA--[protein]-cysteine S-methyltransferase [Sedimentibacter hydroxybenzoicus DSM 7310]